MCQRILAPVDGSATSAKGLEEIIRLGKLTGASLELVNVVDQMSLAFGGDGGGSYSPSTLSRRCSRHARASPALRRSSC